MTHEHDKHDHCEHEEVAYCESCDLVYCKAEDCDKEWSDCQQMHNSTWVYTYPMDVGTTTTINDLNCIHGS